MPRAALCYVGLVTPVTWTRAVIWLALVDVAWAGAPRVRAPRDRDVLARAGAVVRQYQEELPHLVATETTVQRAEPSLGGVVEAPERHLVAEFGWVAAARAPDLIGVRDVIEVDGRRLTTERNRLQLLLHSEAPATIADAERLLDESARYNLGEGSRNFNLPTVALFFLHPQTQARFKWSRTNAATEPVWVVDFKERERPTIIRSGTGAAVFSSGRVLIEVETGTVVRTELHVRLDKVDYTLVTTFAPVASLGLTLPARLEERYVTPTGVITGAATYDRYRRFVTEARLLP
jgi:hypothetical protein